MITDHWAVCRLSQAPGLTCLGGCLGNLTSQARSMRKFCWNWITLLTMQRITILLTAWISWESGIGWLWRFRFLTIPHWSQFSLISCQNQALAGWFFFIGWSMWQEGNGVQARHQLLSHFVVGTQCSPFSKGNEQCSPFSREIEVN